MTKSSPLPSSVNKLENGSIEITLTLPWADIQKAYEEAVNETVAQTELPGFRKGKAPRHLVEAKIDRNRTMSHALGHLIPTVYSQAVTDNTLKPVLYPEIKIQKGEEGQDWVVTAITCEAPKVTLPPLTPPEKLKLPEILDWLVKNSQIVLPAMIVEHESDQRLSRLAENLSQLGVSIDKYLESKKMTLPDLKAENLQLAKADLSLEFALQQLQVQLGLDNRQKTLDHLELYGQPSV